MDTKQTTTVDLLCLLTDRAARKHAWLHDPGTWGDYVDSIDDRMRNDIIDTLAARIDGKERGPEPKDPLAEAP